MKKQPINKRKALNKPTEAQLLARQRFAEQARNRAGYKLQVKLNGQTFNYKTQDLSKTLYELGQTIRFIKTRMILNIIKGKKTCDRLVFAPMARQIFRNKIYREFFTRKLIFK